VGAPVAGSDASAAHLFPRVAADYIRGTTWPGFEWLTQTAPSPRHVLRTPLTRARVALVGTAGAYVPGQDRFSLEDAGDHSYREIPAGAPRLRFSHPGFDTRFAYRDPDVAFPLALLRQLEQEGRIGSLSPRAFSFMGYIPEPGPLVDGTGPEVAEALEADGVDLVLLVPV
jgi:D-proline reductase (dithiol) PrdB